METRSATQTTADVSLVRQALAFYRSKSGLRGSTVADAAMDRIEAILLEDGHVFESVTEDR